MDEEGSSQIWIILAGVGDAYLTSKGPRGNPIKVFFFFLLITVFFFYEFLK